MKKQLHDGLCGAEEEEGGEKGEEARTALGFVKDIWVFLLALSPLFAPRSLWRSSVRHTAHGWRVWGGGLPCHTSTGGAAGGRAVGSRQRSHNSNYNLFVMFLFFLSVWLFLSFFLAKTIGVGCTPGLLCMCVVKLGGGERERCKGLNDSLSSGY